MKKEMPIGLKQLFSTITYLKPEEKVLVITDENMLEVGNFVYQYAKDMFETSMIVMPARKFPGDEPTEGVLAALNACDVAFGATTYSLYHSKARLETSKNGRLRWIGLQDVSLDMFESGGLTADFDHVTETVDRVAKVYNGDTFTLTAPGGTHLTCSVKGRTPVKDYGTARVPGAAAAPPNAEIALGPVEGTSEGVLVIDGSIPHPLLNLIEKPITCVVEKGFITEIRGGREADVLRNILSKFNDHNVYNVGELGMGLNEKNVLCGHMAPDEGSFGNIHVGIGKNTNFGGHVVAPIHLDLVIKTVTCDIDGRIIMKDGVLMV